MITLEVFEEIMKELKRVDEDNEKLTNILIRDNYGFVDYNHRLTKIINDLLLNIFDSDDPDIFDWWLYEKVEKIVNWNKVKYDLTNIEDLYYWVKKEYDKVKKKQV